MTRNSFRKLSFILTAVVLFSTLYLSTTYATLAPLTPPPSGGYDAGSNSILDPGCIPGATDCFVKEFQGWKLTGNSGTDGGVTNFIGTTDAQDFVIKTSGLQVALFSYNGGTVLGSTFNSSIIHGSALGANSVAIGTNTLAAGNAVAGFVSGVNTQVSSIGEVALGANNTPFAALSGGPDWAIRDRLFTIGNGETDLLKHNAYTLWKDGSFAYNDDNFQNDNPGTEQNMFYFNYGNHDGQDALQGKRAIRLGSALNDEWDINSANVGDSSVAIGFSYSLYSLPAPIASGPVSIAIGVNSVASGAASFALGGTASGTGAVAMGGGVASGSGGMAFGGTASGDNSYSFGINTTAPGYVNTTAAGQGSYAFGGNSQALGRESFVMGIGVTAYSFNEIAIGRATTIYTPNHVSDGFFGDNDRLFTIGNGEVNLFNSDALTILKNGETGIGIDNFEANTNGNIFQVGDGTTNVIGYVDDVTGNWVAVSDERKKENITDLAYGLDQILQLRPTSFDYRRNHEHTIGFIAQQVLPIIPETVYGSDSEGYGMSYATLTPVIVKAIQEMNLNIIDLNTSSRTNTWRDALIGWFGNVGNGIHDIFVTRAHVEELCIGTSGNETCLSKDQVDQILGATNTAVPTPVVDTPPSEIPPPTEEPPVEPTPPVEPPTVDTPSETVI